MPTMLPFAPEDVHPALWRASQLARSAGQGAVIGHAALAAHLPGGVWPQGALIELLLPQDGIGELRLLCPALQALARPRIALVQPPQQPQALGWAQSGVAPSRLLWVRGAKSGDTLWAAEQMLRSGSMGALLLWQRQIRLESLRRLHLAAQGGDTLFFMLRPLAAAQDPSPATLRLSVRPAPGGVRIGFVKRRGPQSDASLLLVLPPLSVVSERHDPVDRPAFAAARAGSVSTELVG